MIRYFLSATLLIASIATQAFAMREIPGIHIPSSSIRTANTRLPEPIKELAQKVIESANDNSDLHNKVCNFLYARERLINSFVLEKIAASAGRDDKALDIISLDYINLQGELLASFPKEIQKIFESIDNEIEKENLGMSFFEILTIYENRDAFAPTAEPG